jgi:hypothetical protein
VVVRGVIDDVKARPERRVATLRKRIETLDTKLFIYDRGLAQEDSVEAAEWAVKAYAKRRAAKEKGSQADKSWSVKQVDQAQAEAYQLLEAAAQDYRRAFLAANLPVPTME